MMLIVKGLKGNTMFGNTRIKRYFRNDLESFKKYQISEQGNFEGSNILVENLDSNISTDQNFRN